MPDVGLLRRLSLLDPIAVSEERAGRLHMQEESCTELIFCLLCKPVQFFKAETYAHDIGRVPFIPVPVGGGHKSSVRQHLNTRISGIILPAAG